ncbi:MAG: hypothetical protein LBH84_09360 [Prevotellaceae bacterium]|jgi:hypothetical protein|nr:hypothetical protein [Prevotellaceae bacterium]
MTPPNILEYRELDKNPAIKNYLIVASDGKQYNVTFYGLDMILVVGFSHFSQARREVKALSNKYIHRHLPNLTESSPPPSFRSGAEEPQPVTADGNGVACISFSPNFSTKQPY